jgi:uncharacterized protein (DUF2141 family)
MPNYLTAFAAAALALGATAAPAALGPHAAQCNARSGNAMLVRVIGLKARVGNLRVQSYAGDPDKFLDKGRYFERVELAPPAAGPVEVCMPVPAPGIYAVAVRHQATGLKSSNTEDGGGVSGNPKRSVFDLAFGRKPDPEAISVRVQGITVVPIIVNYLQGGSFKPVTTAER